MAQATAADVSRKAGPRLETVLVTARKQEESAQDVPVAMTALTQELEQATVRDLRDLNGYSANVRIDNDPSRAGAAAITIRGISPTRTDDNSFDSPIAIMIDGIYLGSLSGQIIENFDIERIEILRGPQGTLYGRNTVGGVLNAVRSRPTGEFGAKLQYTFGRWNQHEFRGVFNAPIVRDKLAVKGFFTNLQRDGYYKNEYLNSTQPQRDYMNYGLTLLATPNEWLEVKLTVERFEDHSQGGAYLTNWNFAPGVLPATGRPEDPNYAGGFLSCFLPGLISAVPSVPCRTQVDFPRKTIATDLPNPGRVNTNAYTLDVSASLSEEMKLVGLFGYRDMKEYRKYDFDGTSVDHITIERDNEFEQFSGELRLEGSWDTSIGKINALVGTYYWNSKFNQNWVTGGDFWTFIGALSGYSLAANSWLDPSLAGFTGYSTPVEACLAPRPDGSNVKALFGQVECDRGAGVRAYGPKLVQKLFEDQKTTSQAAFAHADWEFMPGWTLEAGIRWTYEKKHFIAAQAYLAPLDRVDEVGYPAYADLKNSWKDISPKVGLSWKATDNVMLYGSYSEGWHSGGFFGVNQNVADFERDQYDPEHSQSIELGLKAQWFDNRLQTNIALFRNTFKNKQEQAVQFDDSTNTVATVFSNVANVVYQGIEGEIQAAVTENLSLFGSVGYLDAKYKNFFTDVNPNDNCTGAPECIVDASYLSPRNAPKLTVGIGGAFTIPLGPGDLQINAKYSYISKVEGNLLNQTLGRVPPRDDLSASVSYMWERYKVTVFGRNLTNERYETPSIIAPLFAAGTVGEGWSWGIEVSGEF
ncbi:TonB-dependent receptor [Iodidimonas sp. SYSU 1G8]|uniref:TonB-dependent receptor n=1 Tax=Iodidimonas sp. SYSU 1G8 TaxID=3133967 RepID=UPI0031FF1041